MIFVYDFRQQMGLSLTPLFPDGDEDKDADIVSSTGTGSGNRYGNVTAMQLNNNAAAANANYNGGNSINNFGLDALSPVPLQLFYIDERMTGNVKSSHAIPTIIWANESCPPS